MADVQIYHRVNQGPGDPRSHRGVQIEQMMGLLSETQRELDGVAHLIHAGAKANHEAMQRAGDYSEGDSEITVEVEQGSMDRFVVMSDLRGAEAAWVIELGYPGGPKKKRQPGKFTLQKAVLAATAGTAAEARWLKGGVV